MGADLTINAMAQDPVSGIHEFTNGAMADVVIEATGVADVVETCLKSLRKGGRLSLAGYFTRRQRLRWGSCAAGIEYPGQYLLYMVRFSGLY